MNINKNNDLLSIPPEQFDNEFNKISDLVERSVKVIDLFDKIYEKLSSLPTDIDFSRLDFLEQEISYIHEELKGKKDKKNWKG